MTLVSKLRQKLAEALPSAERQDLQVADADSGSAVTIALVRHDAMSCLAWELRVRRQAPTGVDMRQWADEIAECVTSLLEPLQVLEVDTLRNQALLRSTMPTRQQDCPTYFEVLLDGTTTATVRRYQAATLNRAEGEVSTRREQTAFALTHEGLLKLVGDLI